MADGLANWVDGCCKRDRGDERVMLRALKAERSQIKFFVLVLIISSAAGKVIASWRSAGSCRSHY